MDTLIELLKLASSIVSFLKSVVDLVKSMRDRDPGTSRTKSRRREPAKKKTR